MPVTLKIPTVLLAVLQIFSCKKKKGLCTTGMLCSIHC